MNSLISILPIVARRLAANGRLMAAVLAGAVLAAALMATTAIYPDAIRDLGLTYSIRERGEDRINIRIDSSSQPSLAEVRNRDRDFVDASIRDSISVLIDGPTTAYGRSATFFPTPPGAAVSPDEGRLRSHFQFISNLEPHVRVVEGRLPASTRRSGTGPPSLEVAIGGDTARDLGLRLGDRFDLHPFWLPNAEPVHVTLVGVVDPIDPDEAYWRDLQGLFFFPNPGWDTLPFFIAEDTYFDAVAAYLPTMSSDYTYLVYLDTNPIVATNAESVRLSVVNLTDRLTTGLQRTSLVSDLPAAIESFDQKLFFTRIPLLVLLLQIAAIVLYYLFMVSTMLVERQASEIALLKSRGATTLQVMQVYAVEGAAIVLVALGIGPPLAAVVISLLGHTPPFDDLSGGANLRVTLSGAAYAWAAAGALLAYAALLWPAYQATRRTIIQQRTASARPPREPAFTRYYLDLVLVGVGAILLYQLNRRGGLVTESLFGEQSADPVLLLTPAFFILTLGIVFLRLFPLALRLLSWAIARLQGAALLVGTWQLVRNPVHYSRLVLLLMLATAVGMFAASFGSTVDHSYSDRAAYESGASLRLGGVRDAAGAAPEVLAERVRAETNAEAATALIRLDGSHGTAFDSVDFELLGIDPSSFGNVAFFRDDFAPRSLSSLLARLSEDDPAASAVVLPADARWLGVWVNPVDLRGRVGIEARLRDAAGRFFTYELGPPGSELAAGWSFLAADLSQPALSNTQRGATPELPLTLESLSVRFVTRVSAANGAVQLDDLQTTTAAALPGALATSRILSDPDRAQQPFANRQVIAAFDSVSEWQSLRAAASERGGEELRSVLAGSAGRAIELRWQPGGGESGARGLRPRREERPISVIASDAFLDQTGLRVGDRTELYLQNGLIDVEIVDRFRLFPTLADPRLEPGIIVNGRRLQAVLSLNPRAGVTAADEVWLRAGPDAVATAKAQVSQGRLASTLVSFDDLRAAQESDPLIAAGWEGLLFLSFAAILILSALGFVIYSYLTAQKRRLEFAVLRTMGFSRRQIAFAVGFEQAFIIGLGMLAGTLLGIRLGGLMIRYMGVTETGDQVLPPMLLQVSWPTIAGALAVLGVAFLATVGVVILLYAGLALHRVLRIGEI